MLSNIILIILQFIGAFLGAPEVLRFIPISGDAAIFVHAILYAVIVYVIGLLCALVLKGVWRRSPSALVLSMILAAAGAAVIVFLPSVLHAIPLRFPPLYLPLGLAILGYFMRR